MKAELIEKLIAAHCSGVESRFKEALETLAKDEEKKGNVPLASRIRTSYSAKAAAGNANHYQASDSNLFSAQSAADSTPRDKDSLLELYEINTPSVQLADIVLPENQETIIRQVIEEQANSEELLKHKLSPANRLLLCGPPGCGKTMTANAIARELGLQIAYVRLDGLVSSYLGQTSANLRKVFDSVRDKRIVLFLDEFDAIAKKRDDTNELGELKRVVTTLLQNFDNMPQNVLLIAATNHDHLLDPAIWRRFNVTVTLEPPGEQQRIQLMKKWFTEYGIEDGQLNYQKLTDVTAGLSGAQIKELVLAAVKKNLLHNELATDDVTAILIQQLTKYSADSDDTLTVISDMIARGVSLRQAAKALGMPHTTLDYQLKKLKGEASEQ